ncbi:MAG: indolepyruvate ferredoxin oxidoreductase family protein [Proteobacteria bacterium]|nr:indolepyruvate ferredoxin oxidoreductase family protein [Pseudomonadota bacterium]
MPPAGQALLDVSLDDKYTADHGRVFLTGTQALLRLTLMQRQRDLAAGLNTAGFVTGYRGSPLGGLDQAMWKAKRHLKEHHIHFTPGVNEDLAAAACWGTQQVNMYEGARYDGVFSMWYGKGPGVDRCGDVFKHANAAGTSPHGGVLVLAGDDHAAKSSTLAHQSEHEFISAMIPVLNPSGVQEFLDLGLYGWAMSRYSGCWVAFKCTGETVDSTASVSVDPHRIRFATPTDFEMPPTGVHMRWPDHWTDQEYRLQKYKVYAALAFARANRLDKIVIDSPNPRIGIVTTGKSYLDVRQALEDLGIDEALAAKIGLRVYKVAMPWPLEREGARHFAEGLEEVLVVEEKRALIENQFKEQLYNWRADVRPRVVGKFDEKGQWILPSSGELTPAMIARVIARRLEPFFTSERIRERVALIDAKEKSPEGHAFKRVPYFCSGCPHNSSTKVPEGSRAMAGIGCHFMSIWMDRGTSTFTHMGGEGTPWIGQAPFTETKHVFQNLGDGTFYHSGSLAIRAAVAAKVNITYKILFNDAVAMTGGQPHDGPLTVPQITRMVAAEGVSRIVITSDEPDKYGAAQFAPGVTIRDRDDLDAVQRELREEQGVTILIHDQTCAAEKRRRRKRGTYPDPAKRIFINEAVCEGCGDCSVKSNCLSVIPVETEFGRKRAIDQSSCNKDFSCTKGFCPSFVNVLGGRVRKPREKRAEGSADPFAVLPAPQIPALDHPYGIVVTGVGGTGVVTVGALIGMAAHLEGKGVSILDMAGLAQKGGAVVSHIRIAKTADELNAVRIAAGEANLLLGCDLVVAAGAETLDKTRVGHTRAVINGYESPTGDFTRNPDLVFPGQEMKDVIAHALGQGAMDVVDATKLATALMGDSIATNPFMLGFAWQKGLIPVGLEAILRAIELNEVAIEANKRAFQWGRLAAVDAAKVREAAAPTMPAERKIARTLDEIVAARVEHLTGYQDASLAARYESLVRKVEAAEKAATPGRTGLALAVARYYAKLLSYKDEYEVARLYSDGAFRAALARQFEGDYRIELNLAPPLVAERDATTGHLKKRTYGPWMLAAFGVLAKLKFLRGTKLDPFGRMEERKTERALIGEYEATIAEILANLTPANHGAAVGLASLPEEIRGYGHVRDAHLAKAKAHGEILRANFRNPTAVTQAAE